MISHISYIIYLYYDLENPSWYSQHTSACNAAILASDSARASFSRCTSTENPDDQSATGVEKKNILVSRKKHIAKVYYILYIYTINKYINIYIYYIKILHIYICISVWKTKIIDKNKPATNHPAAALVPPSPPFGHASRLPAAVAPRPEMDTSYGWLFIWLWLLLLLLIVDIKYYSIKPWLSWLISFNADYSWLFELLWWWYYSMICMIYEWNMIS